MSAPDRFPPSSPGKVVFVGQGPNRASWERGLGLAAGFHGLTEPAAVLQMAERYCARIAVTGAVGKKLAALGGFPFSIRFGGYARRNLNARFGGKAGRGDAFDRDAGEEVAAEILAAGEFTHYVLLGGEVARCFGVRAEFLEERKSRDDARGFWRHFLVFPHPSGLSTWWNDDFNRFRAKKRLREFLDLEP